MENIQSPQEQNNSQKPYRNNNRSLAGLFIIVVGILLFVRILGRQFLWVPDWFFTWPMILIAVGIFSGLRHNFRSRGWIILVLIGGFFLISNEMPDYDLERFTAPFILVVVGLMMLFRPKRNFRNRFDGGDFWNGPRKRWQERWDGFTSPPPTANNDTAAFTPTSTTTNNSGAEYLDLTAILGSTNKTVFSKNFIGGNVTCIMGGAEIDLSNADIQNKARLDITCFMGGAKLIVPPHWNVYSDATAIMGGIDDKRKHNQVSFDVNKTLVIEGVCIMGGVEINSL